jgi:hypothetical protein
VNDQPAARNACADKPRDRAGHGREHTCQDQRRQAGVTIADTLQPPLLNAVDSRTSRRYPTMTAVTPRSTTRNVAAACMGTGSCERPRVTRGWRYAAPGSSRCRSLLPQKRGTV